MKEIRLNFGGVWEINSNVESHIKQINLNIDSNKDKKIIIDLPISYFDSNILKRISNLNAIEFESKDGRRFKPNDILTINNRFKCMIIDIKNSSLSPIEKFIALYSIVTTYKKYKLGNDKYPDIGRSPYLFLDDDYINCVGICQFLCILCRETGINSTVFADEENEHAICYFYIKDEKYGFDGYFSSDPTNDTISEFDSKNKYHNMIRRITINNNFEKFLNGNLQLSYPKDIIDIGLFSKHIIFLSVSDSNIQKNASSLDLLHSFRDEYEKKKNYINYDVICDAISKVESLGYIPRLREDKNDLRNILFIEQIKEKKIMRESTDELIKYFGSQLINKIKNNKTK